MTSNTVTPFGSRADVKLDHVKRQEKRVVNNPQTSELEQLESNPTPTIELANSINTKYDPQEYDVKFSKFEDTNKTIINIYDANTGELVRQIPPEELLEMQQQLNEFSGNFVDLKA